MKNIKKYRIYCISRYHSWKSALHTWRAKQNHMSQWAFQPEAIPPVPQWSRQKMPLMPLLCVSGKKIWKFAPVQLHMPSLQWIKSEKRKKSTSMCNKQYTKFLGHRQIISILSLVSHQVFPCLAAFKHLIKTGMGCTEKTLNENKKKLKTNRKRQI